MAPLTGCVPTETGGTATLGVGSDSTWACPTGQTHKNPRGLYLKFGGHGPHSTLDLDSMKRNRKLFLIFVVLPMLGSWQNASSLAQEKGTAVAIAEAQEDHHLVLEKRIAALHLDASQSVVALLPLGSNRRDQIGGSGTIVSADGLVLTAAHCFARPGIKLKVLLNDGRTAKATSLGRNIGQDFGMLQITDEGEWPFVEIGNPDELVADEVCLMYGHPDGLKSNRPAVLRLGTFAGIKGNGMLRTSCLMMPGDSGGPLLNLHGKVIGINCEIGVPTDANFHVPVTSFQESWTKLLNSEEWGGSSNGRQFRSRSKPAPKPTKATDKGILLTGGLEALSEGFKEAAEQHSGAVVRIRSARGEELLSTLGLVVAKDGWIVSKSSRIGEFDIRCDVEGMPSCNAAIVARDLKLDLVLLRVPARDLTAAEFIAPGTFAASVGTLLGSIGRDGDPVSAGILGVLPRNIPSTSWGTLGVRFTRTRKGAPEIYEAIAGRPAATSGVRAGDILVALDDERITSEAQARRLLRVTHPAQSVKVTVERESSERHMTVVLGSNDPGRTSFSAEEQHPAEYTVMSKRRSGFPSAFRHDMPLKVWQCGGPVINKKGQVVGLNIARLDRSGSLALPASVVRDFVNAHSQAILLP